MRAEMFNRGKNDTVTNKNKIIFEKSLLGAEEQAFRYRDRYRYRKRDIISTVTLIINFYFTLKFTGTVTAI